MSRKAVGTKWDWLKKEVTVSTLSGTRSAGLCKHTGPQVILSQAPDAAHGALRFGNSPTGFLFCFGRSFLCCVLISSICNSVVYPVCHCMLGCNLFIVLGLIDEIWS